jgi:hypothetical protein
MLNQKAEKRAHSVMEGVGDWGRIGDRETGREGDWERKR